MANNRGLFITFEGIEGLGKTTNINFVANWFQQAGYQVTQTREPGGTPLAEKLREVLLMGWEESISVQTELLLLFAGRAQHIQQVILPALSRQEVVLCDRFTDATYAYQGYGRGLPHQEIEILESSIQDTLVPDLTFLLDADVAVGQRRVETRQVEKDRFEVEQTAFFERVRAGYLSRAKRYPERFRLIKADVPLSEVQAQIIHHLAILTETCEI